LLRVVPKNRMKILELGSSKGTQFPLLLEWSTNGSIYGIDLYEPNVVQAQKHGLHIVLGYVEQMDMFDDNLFDLVCSRHVMEHLGDIEQGMSEIIRVTRHGGYIAHATPDLNYDPEPAHLNHNTLQEWTLIWMRAGIQLKTAKRHSFHGGEVHIVGTKQ